MRGEQAWAGHSITKAIIKQGAIPVLRAASADRAGQLCAKLVATGFDVIELTATIPDWERALQTVVAEFPNAVIGMGTVVTVPVAERALSLGAKFLVSPYPVPVVRELAIRVGVLFAEGGVTPAEVAAASSYGLCKLFPAHLGGVSYLKTLQAILPGALIMPTGGIRIADVSGWLQAGATAVGVGSDFFLADDIAAAAIELRRQVVEGRGIA